MQLNEEVCLVCYGVSILAPKICDKSDPNGYCERTKTGPGRGSGKYLFPIHRTRTVMTVCLKCMDSGTVIIKDDGKILVSTASETENTAADEQPPGDDSRITSEAPSTPALEKS